MKVIIEEKNIYIEIEERGCGMLFINNGVIHICKDEIKCHWCKKNG